MYAELNLVLMYHSIIVLLLCLIIFIAIRTIGLHLQDCSCLDSLGIIKIIDIEKFQVKLEGII